MDKVISADGTPIAYEAVGNGPTVVLVGGAFCDHHVTAELAAALADDFTAVSYDRRGRGESGDTLPYDVRREIEDIEALIRNFGDRAVLHGISSGGALCLVAAAAGAPVDAVSVLKPPYRVSQDAPRVPDGYTDTLVELTSTGRRGDAVAYFMTKAVGQPPEAVDEARTTPMWPALEAMAHTLAYDAHVMGGDASALPEQLLADFPVPVLAVHSTGSPEWLAAGATAVAKAVPHGDSAGLDGQFHEVPAGTLAPVLRAFYQR
jgi:pimeloyl-ACP methyl ester carboxylesterase